MSRPIPFCIFYITDVIPFISYIFVLNECFFPLLFSCEVEVLFRRLQHSHHFHGLLSPLLIVLLTSGEPFEVSLPPKIHPEILEVPEFVRISSLFRKVHPWYSLSTITSPWTVRTSCLK